MKDINNKNEKTNIVVDNTDNNIVNYSADNNILNDNNDNNIVVDNQSSDKNVVNDSADNSLTQDNKNNIDTKKDVDLEYNAFNQVVDETYSEEPESLKQKKLENVSAQVKEIKSRKKKIMNLLFFLLNLVVIAGILVYNILNDTGSGSPFDFKVVNGEFIAVYILLIALTLFLDVYVIIDLILKSTRKFRPFLSFKSFVIMRYYDNITPMSIGGQPFMVSYLLKHNISGSNSLSIPMKKFIVQQLAWLTISLFGLISTLVLHLVNNPLVIIFSVVGFVINFGLILFILLGSTSKKIVRGIALFGLKIATKLHIIKNYNKNLRKVLTFINEYNAIMKDFSHSKLTFFKLIIAQALRFIVYYSIPFAVYSIFATPSIELYFTFFTFTVMIELASSCCPLPGGTGMNEITFSVLFTSYLPSQVFVALLLWRFASYYFWIIIGLLTLTYDFFIGNKKNEKAKLMSNLK